MFPGVAPVGVPACPPPDPTVTLFTPLNVIQVDGTTVTAIWQGGSAPTTGNASSTDVYTYTAIKTAASTYTVLASQTQFK